MSETLPKLSLGDLIGLATATLVQPHTTAQQVAKRDDALRMGWQFVFVYLPIMLATSVLLDWVAQRLDLETFLEFHHYSLLVISTFVIVIIGYPFSRWVWHRLLGWGENIRDLRLCAAAGLGIGVGIFIDPIVTLVQITVFLLIAWLAQSPAETYENASFALATATCLPYIAYGAIVFSGALSTKISKALWPAVLPVLLMMLVVVLLVFLVLGILDFGFGVEL